MKAHPKVGPGGIKCPCCNPYGKSLSHAKRRINRGDRRKIRQALAGR